MQVQQLTFGLPEEWQEGPGGPDHAEDVDVGHHQVLLHRRQLHLPNKIVTRVVHQPPQTCKVQFSYKRNVIFSCSCRSMITEFPLWQAFFCTFLFFFFLISFFLVTVFFFFSPPPPLKMSLYCCYCPFGCFNCLLFLYIIIFFQRDITAINYSALFAIIQFLGNCCGPHDLKESWWTTRNVPDSAHMLLT